MDLEWWKKAVFYQIYPRSFMDSNGDGVGDIAGVIQKLDYLASLGVTALWLCPVYASPNDDNGYDISDYQAVNPEFGAMKDMETLFREVHARGMRIILDLVVNHTSDEHQWFRQARQSRDNPYRDYYIWRDGVDDGPPNNWNSRFSGSAWEWDQTTGQYYLHLFSKKQPDLNWENPKVREEVFALMEFWLDKGADGFRMDVINMISKTPGLPDDAPDKPLRGAAYYINGPKVHQYIAEMRSRVMTGRDVTTVGETKGVDPATALLYAGYGRGELDMVFQFEFDAVDAGPGGKWDIKPWALSDFKRIMSRWRTDLHGKAWNSVYLENHDMPRSASRFGDDRAYHDRSAKLLAFMLFTLGGTPFIYQGQEIGMTNPAFPDISDYRDVQTLNMYRDYQDNRGVPVADIMAKLHYRSRDNARTPVQWSTDEYAGFSTAAPWIGVNPNYTDVNVQAQLADPESILACYRKLAALRRENVVLIDGEFAEHFSDDNRVYAYTKTLGDTAAYILLNFSGESVSARFPEGFARTRLRLALSNVGADGDVLEPWEARLYFRKG